MFVFVEYVTNMKRRATFFLSLFPPSLPPSLFPHRAFPRIQRRMQENHAVVFIDDNRRQTERAGRSRAAAVDDVNANMWVNGSTQASSVSYCSLRVSLCRTTCLFIVPLHSQTHPGMIRAPIERKKLIWTSLGLRAVSVCVCVCISWTGGSTPKMCPHHTCQMLCCLGSL